MPSDAVPGASVWDFLLFSYTTKVVNLGNVAESLETGDLPIVPADIRATSNYAIMRSAIHKFNLRIFRWTPTLGSGWALGYRLIRVNTAGFLTQAALASVAAGLFYVPPFFLSRVVAYLEADPERKDMRWGLFYTAALFGSSVFLYICACHRCSCQSYQVLC